MDFPLVSVAMAYGSISHIDPEKFSKLRAVLPPLISINPTMEARDNRDLEWWNAKGLGIVLFRNGTATRQDYEGKGLRGNLARVMMRQAAECGFRAIQIDCIHNAVTRVWSNPPLPFKGQVGSKLHTQYGVEDRHMEHSFKHVDQRFTKCYVTLR